MINLLMSHAFSSDGDDIQVIMGRMKMLRMRMVVITMLNICKIVNGQRYDLQPLYFELLLIYTL